MRNRSTGTLLRTHYEKLLALVLALALIGLWVHLGLQLTAMKESVRNWTDDLDKMAPAHPFAVEEDVLPYKRATERIEAPFQVNSWTNPLWVPETRLWCVDCRRPIPLLAETCPFCKAVQPKIGDQDSDGDGMPDEWEEKYGLDPRNPLDAGRDDDGDGFTNLEECRHKTDPKDATITPPITEKLRLVDIDAEPFLLLFKSLVRMPDGAYKFGINTRDKSRTHMVAIGDEIEGFKVDSFELRFVDEVRGGVPVKVNKSVLTLMLADKKIPLVYGEEVPHSEFTAKLVFVPDGRTFSLRKGESFTLNEVQYKVLNIDNNSRVVVIERTFDGIELRVVPDA